MEYSEKVILITGASSGIGRAVALALSRYKNSIVITARRKELLESAAEEIRHNGSDCIPYAGDALDPKHADQVVSNIVSKFGRIDIALLNIGIGPPSNTLTASREKILHCMRTNYDTMINYYCPLIQQMKQQKTRCLIAHMNSQATYFGIPMQGDYTASKSAARIFLETARMELKHFGYSHILIQTIHPGFVDTDAVRGDGIPAPNQISEEKSAEYVLKGFKREMRENLFPPGTKYATMFGRIVPHWFLTKVLLSQTPEKY
jgi:NAD(P)-dependent dehydrogenase (short-subunit alcohol dehydrogenase family)